MFDKFYSVVLNLLDTFYPESSVTITSRDPSYMTAHVKAMLRRKNRPNRLIVIVIHRLLTQNAVQINNSDIIYKISYRMRDNS